MSDDIKFRIDDNGDASFSGDAVKELEAPFAEAKGDEALSGEELSGHPVFGSKHTYCCKMGNDGNVSKKQQFRSYSWQAPLFCMRMARNNGYNSGSVSRGECSPDHDE